MALRRHHRWPSRGKCTLRLLALLCSGCVATAATAGGFRSYATVLEVHPIQQTYYEPVSRTVCTDPDADSRPLMPPATSIGEDVRRQISLWQSARSCRTVTEQEARQRTTSYRVTYRYRGHTATTRLSYDPGERMPVNVSLSPLP
jgi:uncharacterized protein YcfJ